MNWIAWKSGIDTPHLHGIIASLIVIVFSWLTTEVSLGIAMGFYTGREFNDWEKIDQDHDIREMIYPIFYAITTYIMIGLIYGKG